MSGQLNDIVRFQDREYQIGEAGQLLFSPRQYDMKPVCLASFCRRGYQAHFLVEEDQLFFDGLEVDLNGVMTRGEIPAPHIGGHQAADGMAPDSTSQFEYVYCGLKIPLVYSGLLVLRDDLVNGMGTGWGYQPDCTFRTVLELKLRMGCLVRTTDLSEKYAAERAEPGFSIQTLF